MAILIGRPNHLAQQILRLPRTSNRTRSAPSATGAPTFSCNFLPPFTDPFPGSTYKPMRHWEKTLCRK